MKTSTFGSEGAAKTMQMRFVLVPHLKTHESYKAVGITDKESGYTEPGCNVSFNVTVPGDTCRESQRRVGQSSRSMSVEKHLGHGQKLLLECVRQLQIATAVPWCCLTDVPVRHSETHNVQ